MKSFNEGSSANSSITTMELLELVELPHRIKVLAVPTFPQLSSPKTGVA
jgi:hypothetical protein